MRPRLQPFYPEIIAHRCGGAHAPENTLAGLRAAAALGVRGVEFDVMLCADGTPVLIHDETLERTTDGCGRVADTSLEALRRLDAGRWFDVCFAGEKIPTFEEAARLCRELGLWANVEIKPATGFEAATGEAVARLARHFWPEAEGVLLSSFSLSALQAARQAAPDLPRALLQEEVGPDWRLLLEESGSLSLHVDWRNLSRGQAAALAAAGVPLACYTVNEPADAARLMAWGVAAVFSDWPDVLLKCRSGPLKGA